MRYGEIGGDRGKLLEQAWLIPHPLGTRAHPLPPRYPNPSPLSQVQLQAELLDLKANPDRAAAGVVVEARQQLGQGAVATALVQKGTLRVGDIVVAGAQWGRVRRLQDERNEEVSESGPSTAVELVGLNGPREM